MYEQLGNDVRATEPGRPSPTKVAIASLIGTTIEWYDFLIYGLMAGLVIDRFFFPQHDAFVSVLLAYATFAVGFVVRPLGGIIFGHFGDRVGRKPLLVLSLMVMGVATFLIGCLPTYSEVGVAAPLLLLAVRIVQGLAIGGEWGGAVLMAYEYAPPRQRAFYASFPQIGLAIGLALGTGVVTLLTVGLTQAQFDAWGWRIAFWLSIALLAVGLFVRLKLVETPEFDRVKEQQEVVKAPIVAVLREYPKTIVLGAGSRMIEGVTFAIYAIFVLTLLVNNAALPRTAILSGITIAALMLVVTIPTASRLADRVGARRMYIWSSIVLGLTGFPALAIMQYSNSSFVAVLCIVVVFGVLYAGVYGPQAALFSELFETRLRYTGSSIVYQVGAIVSVSLTPMIATTLLELGGGQPWWIAAYITAAGFVSAVCMARVRLHADRSA